MARLPQYGVRGRGSIWKVIRHGPKGGERVIATYPSEHIADSVCAELNRWKGIEL